MRIFFLGTFMVICGCGTYDRFVKVQGDIPEIYDECELRLDIPTSQNDRRVVTGHGMCQCPETTMLSYLVSNRSVCRAAFLC